jgi:hypothetical protein
MRKRKFALPHLSAAFIAIATACFLFVFVHRVSAQDAAEAEKAYQRGLVAADQQQWDLAISNFWDAYNRSPREPRYLYSLGIAEANAGRDLAGAAWLHAYLEAAPSAPNAEAVRAEIARLEQSADTDIRQIFSSAPRIYESTKVREYGLSLLAPLAIAQARYGLIDDALATVKEYYAFYSTFQDWEKKLAAEQVFYADKAFLESRVWDAYLEYAMKIHDVGKARAALSNVKDELVRPKALCDYAYVLIWTGDTKAAASALAQAEGATLRLENRIYQSKLLDGIEMGYVWNSQFLDANRVSDIILHAGTPTSGAEYNYYPAVLQGDIGNGFDDEFMTIGHITAFDLTDGTSQWARAAAFLSRKNTSGQIKDQLRESTTSKTDSIMMCNGLDAIVRYLSKGFSDYNYLRAVDFSRNLEHTKAEADRGNPRAQVGLGVFYLYNDQIPDHDKEGAGWMQKAASQNDPLGLDYLGLLYREGRGTSKNLAAAAEMLTKAADLGLSNPESLSDVAEDYYKGGQFPQAVTTQQKAISYTKDKNELAKFQAALRKYQRALELGRQLTDDEIKGLGK